MSRDNRREDHQSRNITPGESFSQIFTVPNSISPSEHKCSPCASQWRYHGDSCYGFFRQNLTWEEGQEYCADQNATLVKAANQRTVEYLAARTTSIRWLGLSRQNSNKDWKWEDGSALRKNVIDLSGNTRGNMNCAYLSKGQIHAASCKDRHYLMCERRAGLTRVDQLL
ncbi:C-type lectin domain family 1 member B isoform X2 [Sigmodon hispidus]